MTTNNSTDKKKIIVGKKTIKKSVKKTDKKVVKKNPPGRPKKEYLDNFIVQKIIEMLKIDGTIEEACAYAGISKSSHHDWIKQNKSFLDKNHEGKEVEILYSDAVENAKQYAGIYARKTIFKAIVRGDEKTAMEYLKRRDSRYRDKQETGLPSNFPSENDFVNDA